MDAPSPEGLLDVCTDSMRVLCSVFVMFAGHDQVGEGQLCVRVPRGAPPPAVQRSSHGISAENIGYVICGLIGTSALIDISVCRY